ncbi:MAG TPA: hypothetical protein VNH42_03980, partial [Mariprofundaceae bacterium]|nr:hypothetical protein [Mariprofundaceae bacterium]
MTRQLAWLALALALWPLTAVAAGRAVVLDDTSELRQGYCEGTVTGAAGGMTTLAIEACQDGGIPGIAPGQTH